MKTFKNLKFKSHPCGNGLQALMFFQNGYGVSVVRFSIMGRYGSYTSDETQWELAVLKGNKNEWEICYDTDITHDVIGYLSNEEVTDYMKQIQQLSKVEEKK